MRITQFMIYDQISRSIQQDLEKISTLHARLASGKKINRPSDDVTGLARAMDYRVNISGSAQYERNIDEAKAQLGFVDAVMTSLREDISRARGLAVGGASGTLDAQTRASLAQDALQLRNHLLTLGNSTFRDRYIFSGFRNDQQAFNTTTYDYQGDNGLINAPIDRAAAMPVNVLGSDALAYTLSAPESAQIAGGKYVYYTPGAATTVQVEIRDIDDITVLYTFSFSNVIQMTDLLSAALAAGDEVRSEALLRPFSAVEDQAVAVQAEVGIRLARLDTHRDLLRAATLNTQEALSSVEDADIARTATELSEAETALKALLASSSRVLSQSLLDFLR